MPLNCETLIRLLLQLLQLLAACQAAAGTRHKYAGYTVHVVFSNHLDVGFTDLDSKVIDLYFHHHLPHAAQLAKDLQASPNNIHGDKFKYLSHSLLLSLFLDCPPNMGWTCPNATERATVVEAIQDGVITWHAAPFNPQYEVFDSSLLRFAFDLTHSLDEHFGLDHKRVASLRDVPGMTRAAIPVLSSKGVRALSSGVNGFSAPPGVPKTTPFIWLDEQSGTQLIYMVHPGGYAGLTPDGLQIDSKQDCISAPGLKHVLCCSWAGDNWGPPADVDTLLAMFDHVRGQWPGATVVGSSLEAFLDGLMGAVAEGGLTLPVVTGEVGDTWIHGIASDPGRMADYRTVLRARRECEVTPGCDHDSPAFFNFSRLLLKVPEHTWGVSFNFFFGDFTNYTNAWLHQHLYEGEDVHPGLAVSLESWRRQRQYIDWALEALPPSHPIRAAVAADRTTRQQLSSISTSGLAAAGAQVAISAHVEEEEEEEEEEEQGAASSAAAAVVTSRRRLASRAAAAAVGRPAGHHEDGPSTAAVAAASSGTSAAADRCAALLSGSDTAAAAAAAAAAGTPVTAGRRRDLLFCSKHWLIEVDRHTGGLRRLQRVYQAEQQQQQQQQQGTVLGNDWAAGDRQHLCSCDIEGQQQHQHQQQQQQQPEGPSPSSNMSKVLQKMCSWWLRVRRYLTAWLPSPQAAAAMADFAVGDEALPAAAAAAGPQSSTAPPPMGLNQQQVLTSAVGASAAHLPRAGPTATSRKLQQLAAPSTGDAGASSSSSSSSGRGCRCRPAFGEVQYNVYNLADYDPVWEHYAYIFPVWVGDFGKNNLSASSNISQEARPRLVAVHHQSSEEGSLSLALQLAFPQWLVKKAGAPARAWVTLTTPADSATLRVTLVWQNKTATRLPEALWLRFKPGPAAVDDSTWLLHKLDGAISPSQLVVNGSHSLHAISTGVRVKSRRHDEALTINSLDVPLVNVGPPNPMPNPCLGPDMREGVSFNPVNNIWGTNYAMWVPYIPSDAHMAFRFDLQANRLPQDVTSTGSTVQQLSRTV